MKKLVTYFVFLVLSFSVWADDHSGPTGRVKVAVDDILTIAKDTSITAEQRNAGLKKAMNDHVDLQASSQRVLARHWRGATREEKLEFMGLFEQVLTNTYGNLLETYNNEEVLFQGEEIKREKYATVDTVVISGGKEIPVTYQLFLRGDEWKIYDFIAEGISLVRTYSNDYQGILRKDGVAGLNKQLAEKLANEASE